MKIKVPQNDCVVRIFSLAQALAKALAQALARLVHAESGDAPM